LPHGCLHLHLILRRVDRGHRRRLHVAYASAP
jgi:hypothetical protein